MYIIHAYKMDFSLGWEGEGNKNISLNKIKTIISSLFININDTCTNFDNTYQIFCVVFHDWIWI